MTPQRKHRLLVTQQEQQDEQRLLEHGLGPISSVIAMRTEHLAMCQRNQSFNRSNEGLGTQIQSPAGSYSTTAIQQS